LRAEKEVARLINLLEQVLSFKNGKGTYAQSLIGNIAIQVPHTKKKLALLLTTSPAAAITLKLHHISFIFSHEH
jgi:hypothetical protein